MESPLSRLRERDREREVTEKQYLSPESPLPQPLSRKRERGVNELIRGS